MANDIDFSAGLSLAEVQEAAVLGTNKSTWVKTLTALAEGVRNGQGKYDTFYKVGTFKNPSGAQTAIRGITKDHADELPAEFDLRPVVKPDPNDASKRVSYLYAAVVAPEGLDDEGDPDEDDLDDEDTDESEEVVEDEAPQPAKRNRAKAGK